MREIGVLRAVPGWLNSTSWGRGVCGESCTRMMSLQIMRERGVVRAIPGWLNSTSWGRGVCGESSTSMISLQIMMERAVVRAISGWYYSKSWERGVVRAMPEWYYSKSWGRRLSWELYQVDITPNREGEVCGESYTRMILLQIMRERGVVRGIPGWCYSKSTRRVVWWDIYQDDITPYHGGEGCGESSNRMILLQINRERGVMRITSGWHFSTSWGRGVWWELFQYDITPNRQGEGCCESCNRIILLQIMRERGVVRAMPGW